MQLSMMQLETSVADWNRKKSEIMTEKTMESDVL